MNGIDMGASLHALTGDKCAIFGVYAPGEEAARLVHTGLWTLQHRGQESTGISVSDGAALRTHKGQGLVAHVYDEEILLPLGGQITIGHNRYSTSGGGGQRHSQPVTSGAGALALGRVGDGYVVSSESRAIDAIGGRSSATCDQASWW